MIEKTQEAKRWVGPSFRMHRATYCGHGRAAVKPGIAVARYSEWADTTSSNSRARTASTDLPSRPGEAFQGQGSRGGGCALPGRPGGGARGWHRRGRRRGLLRSGQYQAYPTYPGACQGVYNVSQNGANGGEPMHFNATSNSSAAGMLYSAMARP